MRRLTSAALAWLLLLAAPVLAQEGASPPDARARKRALRAAQEPVRSAQQFRRLKVEGSENKDAVARLTSGLTWHATLAEAQRAAAAEGKPILWIQALGDLQGYT